MHETTFESYRPLLFAIAYRMLGNALDAEDIVQDAYVRWQGVDFASVESPKHFLTTIVTRISINRLNAARTQRETYLGTWLPEPIFTEGRPGLVNPLDRITTVDSISLAFLKLLETLSPSERAVLLLRDVFEYQYDEIAQMLDKSEEACRQLFSRARKHIQANRPRFDVNPEDQRLLLERFLEVMETGRIEGLVEMLAEDAVLMADGGGQRGAAIREVHGRDAVAQFLLGTRKLAPESYRFAIEEVNGSPAILMIAGEDEPYVLIAFDSWQQRVTRVHLIAGEKLRGLSTDLEL